MLGMAVLPRGSASLAGPRPSSPGGPSPQGDSDLRVAADRNRSLRTGARALRLTSLAAGVSLLLAPDARAEQLASCRVINVDFTPSGRPASSKSPAIDPQLVAWIEKPTGEYVATIFITAQTGRYGIGNRPGRYDFNSGPSWPYGRRTTVLPVWAHRHGVVFPLIGYRNGEDSNLSHPSAQSSRETHFCRPMQQGEAQWDAATCSSAIYTDKGVFQPITDDQRSYYPPRSDLIPVPGTDSSSVADYKQMNPFDAVSQATPHQGTATQVSWPVPKDLAPGNYVLFMEVSLEQDFNDAYTDALRPPPTVSYGTYGVPYRGQPSVVYSVPFQVSDDRETFAKTDTYAGYGDAGPAGPPYGDSDDSRSDRKVTGTLHQPDTTITTGAARLMMMSKDGETFRLRVNSRPEFDHVAPGQPGDMLIADTATSDAKLSFVAAGNDGSLGTVKGYEVRYRVGDHLITEAEFDTANEAPFTGTIVGPGQRQDIVIRNLLPETTYTFAVRAFDSCHNTSNVTSASFTTSPRQVGEVDACFIATAAYGSVLAGDVELLRRFRDRALRKSVLGELAVEAYYTFGPTLAGVIGESELLRSTSRDILAPIVHWVRSTATR